MMWRTVGVGLLAFWLTFAEVYVATEETNAVVSQRRLAAAHWTAVFEAILVLDIWLVVGDRWLAIPFITGAWCGRWWAMRDRRRI